MPIEVRKPKVSRYSEAQFECQSGHVTKKWCWNDLFDLDCSTCGEPASRLLPRRLLKAQGVEPMRYAVDPTTGKLWIPGRSDAKPPKGYVSREVRTWRDRDLFYKEQRERVEMEHQEFALSHQYEFGSLIEDGHSRLRDYLAQDHIPEIDRETNQPTGRMVRLTEEGRDLIRMALGKEGYRPPEWSGADVAIDAWENDNPSYNDRETQFRERRY